MAERKTSKSSRTQAEAVIPPRWIRLIKVKQEGIPTFEHPDGGSISLSGSFHVRWPDGTVSQANVKSIVAYTAKRDGTQVSGTYTFFEVPFNGLDLIYDLHEVELLADEIDNRRPATKKSGKAA